MACHQPIFSIYWCVRPSLLTCAGAQITRFRRAAVWKIFCRGAYLFSSLNNHFIPILYTHDEDGNVEGSISIDDEPDSFDIFGVSAKSLLKLINKYVEAGFPNTPFNYKGMGIPSNNNNELATLQIQSLRLNIAYEMA